MDSKDRTILPNDLKPGSLVTIDATIAEPARDGFVTVALPVRSKDGAEVGQQKIAVWLGDVQHDGKYQTHGTEQPKDDVDADALLDVTEYLAKFGPFEGTYTAEQVRSILSQAAVDFAGRMTIQANDDSVNRDRILIAVGAVIDRDRTDPSLANDWQSRLEDIAELLNGGKSPDEILGTEING